MLFALCAFMIFLLIIQVSPMIVYKRWKELAVYMMFWAAAFTYGFLVVGEYPIPSVSGIIIAAVVYVRRLLGFG